MPSYIKKVIKLRKREMESFRMLCGKEKILKDPIPTCRDGIFNDDVLKDKQFVVKEKFEKDSIFSSSNNFL